MIARLNLQLHVEGAGGEDRPPPPIEDKATTAITHRWDNIWSLINQSSTIGPDQVISRLIANTLTSQTVATALQGEIFLEVYRA